LVDQVLSIALARYVLLALHCSAKDADIAIVPSSVFSTSIGPRYPNTMLTGQSERSLIHVLCSRFCICGNREYHNYGDLLKVLSSNQSSPTQTYCVTKEEELGKLLDTEKIRDKGCLQLVKVVVGRDDAPPALRRALNIKPKDLETYEKMGGIINERSCIGLVVEFGDVCNEILVSLSWCAYYI